MVPVKKMERIINNIRKKCVCRGAGCNLCVSKINRMRTYAKAGIPVIYWNLSFKDFKGDPRFAGKIREILKDMDKFYDEGKSYAFIGTLGTGKSYSACCILRSALVKGYTGHYTQMTEIVNKILSGKGNENYMSQILEYDVLVIDEFDPRHIFPSEKVERIFGSNFEYILRTRFQNGMPTIVCSNAADIDQVLTSDFAKAFSSLKDMYMNVFVVSGKDFRKAN